MFREMRRIKQQISAEECVRVLKEEKRGVLAVHGDDGYPYAVPVNFIYDDKNHSIYFHCAKEGHKLDSILKNDKVCFTVHDNGYQKEDWSYYVTSVIVFGRASVMEEGEEKYNICYRFGSKYYPDKEGVDFEMQKAYSRVNMVCIKIEHMTGKLVHEK
ncbi:MAG: pyridoxamine 5'-phosphate oxidase family protein [Sphaerochaetaceae bacterium]|nr:pyridoxamine 5'-phosphate oxidase family protein [Sphaerochaetaceae bacterium]